MVKTPSNNRSPWTKEDDDYIRREYPHRCGSELAQVLGRTHEALMSRSAILGVRKSMTRTEREKAWWAVYRGDDYITQGTLQDISEHMDTSVDAARYHTYPYQMKRAASSPGRLRFMFVAEE